MGRIRSVKPEFCKSLSITELSRDARLHFVMLWTYADDEGRGVNEPRLLKGELWPMDDDIVAADVAAFQNELEANGRLVQYDVNGRPYFQITNWKEHQHPQRPKASTIPGPDEADPCNDADVVHVQDMYATTPVHVPSVGEGRVEVEVDVGESVVRRASDVETRPQPIDSETAARLRDAEELCEQLADLLEANPPNSVRPPVSKAWITDMERALRIDGRSRASIEGLFAYVFYESDGFWISNMRSPKTVRDKFDQIRAQKHRDDNPKHVREGSITALSKVLDEVDYGGTFADEQPELTA